MPITHFCLLWPGDAVADEESMIARTVRRHRPHSEPAPQASDTWLHVAAPAATAFETASIVTP